MARKRPILDEQARRDEVKAVICMEWQAFDFLQQASSCVAVDEDGCCRTCGYRAEET